MDQMWSGGFPNGPLDIHNSPGGLINIVSYKPRLFARTVLQDLLKALKEKNGN